MVNTGGFSCKLTPFQASPSHVGGDVLHVARVHEVREVEGKLRRTVASFCDISVVYSLKQDKGSRYNKMIDTFR